MRQVEIIQATGEKPRLTITPTRCTLKLLVGDPRNKIYERAAKAINSVHSFPIAIRGAFQSDTESIKLNSEHRANGMPCSDRFEYDFNGNLLASFIADRSNGHESR